MPTPPETPIPVPVVETDEPVAVMPLASVAPLDGTPDGERINVFSVVPQARGDALGAFQGDMRERVTDKPLTSVAIAFSLGFMLARLLR